MNQYTVGLATEALARTIEDEGAEAKKRGVAIAYDVRHKSKEFAQITAGVLAKHGIKVYIHKEIQPTPILSHHNFKFFLPEQFYKPEFHS